MLEHVIHIIIIAAFALGIRASVRALTENTALGKCKPFNCDTCLCWWGSVIGTALIVFWLLNPFLIPLAEIIAVVAIYPLAALGLAKHLLRSSDKTIRMDTLPQSVLDSMGEPPIEFIGDEDDAPEADPDDPEIELEDDEHHAGNRRG